MPAGSDQRLDRIEEEISALKTSTAYGLGQLSERLDGVRDTLNAVANRPPQGIPVWVVLTMALPGTLLGFATLLIALTLRGP